MIEGMLVKVIEGEGLPDPILVDGVGRIVGHYGNTPIVVVRKGTLIRGSAWAIPENCLKVITEVDLHVGKVAWSPKFHCMIECTSYADDSSWTFQLINGNAFEKTRTAESPYSSFNWMKKEEVYQV